MKSNKLKELEEKVKKGLELARIKMIDFKREKGTPIVVSKDGKVIEIKP
ncbi:MAG: hypothetical protein ACPF8V_07110 [Luteibaculum sp.]